MVLAVDIGNSHIKLAGFHKTTLLWVSSIATDVRWTGEQYAITIQQLLTLHQVATQDIQGVVLSSVVPSVASVMEQALMFLKLPKALQLSSGVKTGINIRLDQPKGLGSDLVANAVWAVHRGNLPCVVVDVGTLTTFTAVDAQGVLMGTSIAAAPQMVLAGMKQSAAQLPSIALHAPLHGVAGRNTQEAMQAGVLLGTACMIDGMLAHYEAQLHAKPWVWLTGGGAQWIYPHLKREVEREDWMTLRGLQCIWEKNQSK